MNVEETVSGIRLGLERMKELMARMGNPQNDLKFVHIAGTNGKGSITAMIANVLIKAGYRTGMYTSPFVVSFNESIQCNGMPIDEWELADCTSYVKKYADAMMQESGDGPTRFEVETAVAIEWFKRKQCDMVCLEVGLGGRLDATNIIGVPVLSVITSVSCDHTAFLGNTLKEIAHEKAGIIKGGPVVMYPLQEPEVTEAIRSKCQETGSSLSVPDLNMLTVLNHNWLRPEFEYEGQTFYCSLHGQFQIYNAITVFEAVRSLRKAGFKISMENITYGIAHTALPARLELLSEKPLVLLDGSHNPAAAKELKPVLAGLKGKRIIAVMGIMSDKDYPAVLSCLAPCLSHLITTTVHSPRALSAKALAVAAGPMIQNITVCEESADACKMGFDMVSNAESSLGNCEDVLIICGSFYLAAEVRQMVIEMAAGLTGRN